MIPIHKKITELTWGEIVADLDQRYGKGRVVTGKQNYLNPATEGFINVKQCAALTGYTEGYIRQLVFKLEIPFYKNPKRKPIRFKHSEILEWMATKKFTPIDELAENYVSENSINRKSNRKLLI